MLSEYITSLANVSFHIVAYMYVRFRYSGKNPLRFAVFLAYFCAVLRFSDTPLRPPHFSVHKYISQCTNVFLSARQISLHKSCLNEKCNLSVHMQSFLSEFLQVSYFLVSLFSSVGGHICSSRAIQDSFLLLWRKRDSKVSRLSLSGSLLFRSEYHNSMLCASSGAIVQILFAFCPSCGSNNLRNIHGKDMDKLLRYYFQKGFSYKNIWTG